MKVSRLTVKNYRNIDFLEFFPNDEMNVLWGENAQGKTNILEAIWLFTGAKSFRSAKDQEFIKIGTKEALISLDFIGEGIEKNAEISFKEKKNATFLGNNLKSASLLAGNFKAVVFSPADLRIITDGPNIRRRFLDVGIGLLYPSYIENLKNYLRAVTQRNKIIKELRYDPSIEIMLDVFEEEIEKNGKKIVEARKKYLALINEFLPEIYNGISNGKERLETEYICSFSEKFREELKLNRKEDTFSGVTGIGPHRDDIDFKINSLSARSFGSQGQKRSIALSLKLAEAEVIKKIVGECPVFLLDDVMSELDPERQSFILNHIKGMQVFITCCDPSNIKSLKEGKIFEVKKGAIV